MTGPHFRRAVLEFLVNNDVLSEGLRSRMLGWRQEGRQGPPPSWRLRERTVRVPAEDAEGRKKLAGTVLPTPMSLEKMTGERQSSCPV